VITIAGIRTQVLKSRSGSSLSGVGDEIAVVDLAAGDATSLRSPGLFTGPPAVFSGDGVSVFFWSGVCLGGSGSSACGIAPLKHRLNAVSFPGGVGKVVAFGPRYGLVRPAPDGKHLAISVAHFDVKGTFFRDLQAVK
jgi:hypothetical protein